MSKQTQVISQLIAYFIGNGTLTAAEIAKLEAEGFIDEPRIISPVYVYEKSFEAYAVNDLKWFHTARLVFWMHWPGFGVGNKKNESKAFDFLFERLRKHYYPWDDKTDWPRPYFSTWDRDRLEVVVMLNDTTKAIDKNYQDWFESTTNLARK